MEPRFIRLVYHIRYRGVTAKVNLALSVGAPDPATRLHPIASWMVATSFADGLSLRRAEAATSRFDVELAVVEAKDYAAKLQLRFTYASNGCGIYAIDRTTGEEGPIPAFPTPQELWTRIFAGENAWRDRFAAIPLPRQGRQLTDPLLSGDRRVTGAGSPGHRPQPHPAHPGHRHRQDLDWGSPVSEDKSTRVTP